MVQIDFLYTELGITPPSLDDLPAASTSSLTIPSLHHSASASSMNADPFLFTSVSTPTPSSNGCKSSTSLIFQTIESPFISAADLDTSYQRIFARFAAQIEEAESENLNLAEVALTNVDPTPGLLSWASSLHASLSALKSRREAHIQAMYDQLEGLWRRLGVSEEDMDGFVETHRGSTEEVVAEYEEELERMMELKRERMGVFVGNARAEIEKLWNDMMIGEDERRDFAPFVDGKCLRSWRRNPWRLI
jgi:protein regulator of cytokinesis 1